MLVVQHELPAEIPDSDSDIIANTRKLRRSDRPSQGFYISDRRSVRVFGRVKN